MDGRQVMAKTIVVYQYGQNNICWGATGSHVTGPDRKWRDRKSHDQKRPWPEPKITGSDMTGSDRMRMPGFFPRTFFLL
jgi:hypothetical protein